MSFPSSLFPLPGVLQITSPDPSMLASDWPQQNYLPNKACLIGPRETMACVNSPGLWTVDRHSSLFVTLTVVSADMHDHTHTHSPVVVRAGLAMSFKVNCETGILC